MPSTPWSRPSWWPRPSASTCSSGSSATSGPSGRTTRRRSRSSSSTGTCTGSDHPLWNPFSSTPTRRRPCWPRPSTWPASRGRRRGRRTRPELIEYGPLVLNLETYQAACSGRPLDLTYMEYELLKFLATHPGKVFTRETLLSRVWGYEYYGGARTVDVHIRRLRAKL